MGFKCGIVGLPNVGKSTLFNALTKTTAAEAANYPFCTIEPNVGKVAVPDDRLDKLAQLAQSQQIIPNQIEFVDIAGLVKGASKGEGLGNKFLAHIREIDAIIHVVRCFDSGDITHVEGNVDPVRDIEIIDTELMIADMESLQTRINGLQKKAKSKDQEAIDILNLIHKILTVLEQGKPARYADITDEEQQAFKRLQLLTSKPVLYVCNVSEDEITTGNQYVDKVDELAQTQSARHVIISAAIESEIACLDTQEEKEEFLQALGLSKTGLSKVIIEGYKLLNYLTFFTVGPKEARAWNARSGSKAPQAAGVIHGDFERGFICAETISCADYLQHQGEQGAKSAGKVRQEGKDYIVQDGDVFHFRFNV